MTKNLNLSSVYNKVNGCSKFFELYSVISPNHVKICL